MVVHIFFSFIYTVDIQTNACVYNIEEVMFPPSQTSILLHHLCPPQQHQRISCPLCFVGKSMFRVAICSYVQRADFVSLS